MEVLFYEKISMNTSFEVRNVLKSLLNLILWHGLAVWFRRMTLDKVFSVCHLILKQYFSATYTKIAFLTHYMLVMKFNINEIYFNSETLRRSKHWNAALSWFALAVLPTIRGDVFKSVKYLSLSECITFE